MGIVLYVSMRLRCRALLLIVACTLAACATQNLDSERKQLLGEGKFSAALANLRAAMRRDPDNLQYRLEYINLVGDETKRLIKRGEDLRAARDESGARDAFMAALEFDPSSERARRGLADIEMDRRHRGMLAEAEKLFAGGKLDVARERTAAVLRENGGNVQAQRLMREIDARIDAQRREKEGLAASQSILKKPVTLQFRDANLRMVFEALSRTTGLNVIFDRDVRPDLKTTIFVHNGSVEDTVDLILLQNQLAKKVLNANTMFIYPATPAKQKEYQELKVRTFRISNGDPKYILSVLKSVLKVKDVLVDERTNTLVLRDTPEALDVAAKIIAAHDLVDAEVILEVQVLEISRDRLTELGIKWPDSATITTPSGSSGSLTIDELRGLSSGQLLITPLAVGLNLKLQDTAANLLASPRIRVRDHEKAKILIGDKVPIITNSVTPVQTGSAVVTGSIQYIDVGIKLEAEPHVYPEGEVGIKLNLEASNIVKEIAGASGSLAYQIGTRNASTSLRLRDGETQVLGGLISDSDRDTASKVPGIGQLPILGRLFSSHSGDRNKTEIVLSITPRIVRAQGVAEESARDVWSGTEATIHSTQLRLDPISSVSSSSNMAGGSGSIGSPASSSAGIEKAAAASAAPAAPAAENKPASAAAVPAATSTQNNAAAAAPAPVPAAPLGVEVANPTLMFPDGLPRSTPNPPQPARAPPAEPATPPVESPAPQPEKSAAATPATTATTAVATPAVSSIKASPTAIAAITPATAESPASAAPAKNQPVLLAAATTVAAPTLAPSPAPAPTSGEAGSRAAIPSQTATAGSGSSNRFANNAGSNPQITWGALDSVKSGKQFKVSLNVSGFNGVPSLPVYVRYDPRVLSFLGASPGDASTRAGVSLIDPVVDEAVGQINIVLNPAAGKALSGAGELMKLTFSAKAPSRQTQVQMQLAQLGGKGGNALRGIARPQPLIFKIEP